MVNAINVTVVDIPLVATIEVSFYISSYGVGGVVTLLLNIYDAAVVCYSRLKLLLAGSSELEHRDVFDRMVCNAALRTIVMMLKYIKVTVIVSS